MRYKLEVEIYSAMLKVLAWLALPKMHVRIVRIGAKALAQHQQSATV